MSLAPAVGTDVKDARTNRGEARLSGNPYGGDAVC